MNNNNNNNDATTTAQSTLSLQTTSTAETTTANVGCSTLVVVDPSFQEVSSLSCSGLAGDS